MEADDLMRRFDAQQPLDVREAELWVHMPRKVESERIDRLCIDSCGAYERCAAEEGRHGVDETLRTAFRMLCAQRRPITWAVSVEVAEVGLS
jgi:hypothetical protein